MEELIENGQYLEALSYLTDRSDENVRLMRLMCLNGLEEFEQAKNEGMIAKAQANHTYYDVLSQYLISLKETQNFEEAIDILIEELSIPYIPQQYETVFQAVYDDILLEKKDARFELESRQQIFSLEEIEVLLTKDDVNVDLLYMALDQLIQLNIRRIISTIREYLRDEKKPKFAKSLILEIMIDQDIDEEFEVMKDHMMYFNPSQEAMVLERLSYKGIGEILIQHLEDNDPVLLEQCIQFLEYYLYIVYPSYIDESDYLSIAAAIHFYIANMQGYDLDKEDILIDYYCSHEELDEKILALSNIE